MIKVEFNEIEVINVIFGLIDSIKRELEYYNLMKADYESAIKDSLKESQKTRYEAILRITNAHEKQVGKKVYENKFFDDIKGYMIK